MLRNHIITVDTRRLSLLIVGAALTFAIVSCPRPVAAVDVGQPAPDFKLASTQGGDLSLSAFRGNKWVLLEFYGVDFAPT